VGSDGQADRAAVHGGSQGRGIDVSRIRSLTYLIHDESYDLSPSPSLPPFLDSVGAYSDVNLATKVAHDDTK